MMENFARFVENLEAGLAEFFPGVTRFSDVLEHLLLLYLGYNQNEMPERCLHEEEENYLSISCSAPYGVSNREFVESIKKLGKEKGIVVEEINSSTNTVDFIVKLKISDDFFKANKAKLLEYMETDLLAKPEKYQLYRYWSYRAEQYAREKQAQDMTPFSMIANIESRINFFSPYFFSGAVWSAIVRKASVNEKLVVLSEPIVDKLEYSYQIEFSCEDESGNRRTLRFSLNDIANLLRKPANLKGFLLANEFIPFPKANSFLQEKLHRQFRLKSGKYEIDFGSHPELPSQLRKFGIAVNSSYQPNMGDIPRQLRQYAFDKKDYLKALLAIAEIKGRKCLKERSHSLEHYCVNKDWDKLREQLDFFLNFKARTGLDIDYTELAFGLFVYAKENEAAAELGQIIYEAMLFLTDEKRFPSEIIKKANDALYEITLQQITVREEALKPLELAVIERTELNAEVKELKEEIEELKGKLFGYAQKAGLAEANLYLIELCGGELGEEPLGNVVEDPIATIEAMAAEIKKLRQENEALKRQLGIQARSADEVDTGWRKSLDTSDANYAVRKKEWEALKKENEMLLEQLENLKQNQRDSVHFPSGQSGFFKQVMKPIVNSQGDKRIRSLGNC
jgi:hypothetical protein